MKNDQANLGTSVKTEDGNSNESKVSKSRSSFLSSLSDYHQSQLRNYMNAEEDREYRERDAQSNWD